ncbi:MAG: Txe/YoeB family addiction module toxin [Gemmatimonadaceae bacterium]
MSNPESGTGVAIRQNRACHFDPNFIEDLEWWVESKRGIALRVLSLVKAVLRDPHDGIGKPERLKSLGSGVWSRRITQEHRLVYLVLEDRVVFLMARYRY